MRGVKPEIPIKRQTTLESRRPSQTSTNWVHAVLFVVLIVIVVSVDESALKDIVVFEPSIYDKAGGWSASTTALLADGARLRAWRDRALAAYRSRFDPVALLRRADAWNERPRGDL